jgi:hypothetical protein
MRHPLEASGDLDPVSLAGAGPLELAGCHLDDREPAQRPHDPVGGDGAPGLHHPAVPRDEQNVDREPHRKCVHQVRGRNDEGLPRREAVAAEQTFPALGGRERGFNLRGDRQSGPYILQDQRTISATEQRLQKVRTGQEDLRMSPLARTFVGSVAGSRDQKAQNSANFRVLPVASVLTPTAACARFRRPSARVRSADAVPSSLSDGLPSTSITGARTAPRSGRSTTVDRPSPRRSRNGVRGS